MGRSTVSRIAAKDRGPVSNTSYIIACHPRKDDMACGPYSSNLCFCITTKDPTAFGVVLRAQQAISSWQEDMAHEVHDLAAMRPQTMRASTLQAAAGTRANVCPRSSSPGEGRTWPSL